MEFDFVKTSEEFSLEKIFSVDESIKFVGVCSVQGNLVDTQYREDKTPMLSNMQLVIAVMQAAIRHNTRVYPQRNIGKPLYSATPYENVKRATIHFGMDYCYPFRLKKTKTKLNKFIKYS